MSENNPNVMAVPEEAARRALAGDRAALETLVGELQADIYGLAVRMLFNREDAEDATQEILVRIVTRLSQFDFRSRLKTWAFRIAVNYILDARRSPIEKLHLNFEQMADNLEAGISSEAPDDAEESLLIEEVKIACSLAMLQCLDRQHRCAYVLGEILELPGPEAAAALDISSALFRKRLQEARSAVLAFTSKHCGLVSNTARCRCNRQLPAALRDGRIRRDACTYANRPETFNQARAVVHEVDEARRAYALYQSATPRSSSVDFARRLIEIFETRTLSNPVRPEKTT